MKVKVYKSLAIVWQFRNKHPNQNLIHFDSIFSGSYETLSRFNLKDCLLKTTFGYICNDIQNKKDTLDIIWYIKWTRLSDRQKSIKIRKCCFFSVSFISPAFLLVLVWDDLRGLSRWNQVIMYVLDDLNRSSISVFELFFLYFEI